MTATPVRLPMFPLEGVVFPYGGVPLQVFEPRYLELVDRVTRDGSGFGTVMIERGSEVGGGDVRSRVGTLLEIVASRPIEGGRRAVVAAGTQRIRVVEWLLDDPHPWALVESMDDPPEDIADLREGMAAGLGRLRALASELGLDTGDFEVEVDDDPVVASYRFAAMVPVTPLDSYRLLIATGPRERVERAVVMMDEQADVIRATLGGA